MAESVAPVFLTAKQVAAMLQVSEKSILRWAAADPTMPALRIGRTLRFERDRLLAWFRTNTQGFGRPRTHKQTHEDFREQVWT
jgi:excisionase family DNA binding protein